MWWHAMHYPKIPGVVKNTEIEFNATTLNSTWTQRTVQLQHNYRWHYPLLDPRVQEYHADSIADGHCLYTFLLRFNADVETMADDIITGMYGQPNTKFVAAHLRIGGQEGEQKAIIRNLDRFSSLMTVLSCSQTLAKKHSIDTSAVPVLLMTDNNDVRALLRSQRLQGYTTANITASHVIYGQTNLVQQQQTLAELLVLSKATCLLRTRSGFSEIAHMFGGQACSMLIDAYEFCAPV
jgi:hypothetical protein